MQRRLVGPGGIMEMDVAEAQPRALVAGGQGDRRGRGANVGLGGHQFAQPARSARAAQQVAPAFRQRSERARDQPAGQDEGGDAAARQSPGGDIDGAQPHDARDRAEDQGEGDRGHGRAQQDALARGGETALDRRRETRRLALLLAKGLDDLHCAQDFGRGAADVGQPVLAGARQGPHAPAKADQHQQDDGNAQQQQAGQLGRQREEIGEAADGGHHVAQRHRHGGADHLFDDRGVGRQARRDFGRAIFLEEARRLAQQIGLRGAANVGDDAFAEPGHEIEAQRAGDREHQHDQQQIFEPAADVAAAHEPLVDHQAEAVGDGQRRGGGDDERQQRAGDPAGIAAREAPQHRQTAERGPRAVGFYRDILHGRRLAGRSARLNGRVNPMARWRRPVP